MEAAWARGQAILLVGEPGVGKSRLAADFVASKGPALLFEGRPGDLLVPYATAVRSLRRVLSRAAPQALNPSCGAAWGGCCPNSASSRIRVRRPTPACGAAS